jgi:hypothetical protein
MSNNAIQWDHYSPQNKPILGNKDSHSLQYFLFSELVMTRFIRIELISWHNYPGFRVEMLGCRVCDSLLNYPPRSVHMASSSCNWPRDASCSAENAYIDG